MFVTIVLAAGSVCATAIIVLAVSISRAQTLRHQRYWRPNVRPWRPPARRRAAQRGESGDPERFLATLSTAPARSPG
jgi:hypothetical protein